LKTIHRNVLLGVAVLLLAALFVRLGIWQLDRLHQRRATNRGLAAALARPAIPLDSAALARIEANPKAFANRRVRVAGTYLARGQVLLRARTLDGRPGVHVVTPLAVAGTPWTVLVNRGWTYAPDGATPAPPPADEPGPRTVEGVLQEIPVGDDGGLPSTARTGGVALVTLRHLDLLTLRARTPGRLLPMSVQQLPSPASPATRVVPGDGVLHRVPLPAMDEGPHLGYALQWFSFAAIALGGYLVLLFRRREPPRA
jgi:surfeit locus 1 family protein